MPNQVEYFDGCLNALMARLRREKGRLIRAKIRMTMSEYIFRGDKKVSLRGINSCLKWLREGIEIVEGLKSCSIKGKFMGFQEDYKTMIEDYWLNKRMGDYKLKNIKNFIVVDSSKAVEKGVAVCKKRLV